MFKKIVDLFKEVTVGVLKQYQSSAVDLAKIEAASFYLKAVRIVREHLLVFVGMLFCLILAAVAIIVVPAAIVLCTPLALKVKLMVLAMLGLIDIAVPLALLNRFLSEETWLKISKADTVLEKVIG